MIKQYVEAAGNGGLFLADGDIMMIGSLLFEKKPDIYFMKFVFTTLFFASLCTACNNPLQNQDNVPQPIAQLPAIQIDKSADSWGADVILHIFRIEKTSSEKTKYYILSSYQNAPAGFILTVTRPKGKNVFVTNGIKFQSFGGDTSDHFLSALSDIYQVKNAKLSFCDSLMLNYYDLAGGIDTNNPSNWIAAQAKLFFETTEDNAELFMNIDEKAGTVSFPEKDSSYRASIITALSKRKEKK